MSSKPFQIVLWSLLVVAGAAGLSVGRLENNRLRRQLATQRQESAQTERLRTDNQRTRALVARIAADASDGAQAIQDELGRARAEVLELEQQAQASRRQMEAQAARDATSLADNRDPTRGLTRLEHFRNVGQSTPAAAFQTSVWAALKGDDARLAHMIGFAGDGREKAEAAMATLPNEVRAKYPAPENLAALFFAAVLTGTPALEIAEVSVQDGQHAFVRVRGLTTKTETIPMQLGDQGWMVALPPPMADKLGAWVRDGAPAAAKK